MRLVNSPNLPSNAVQAAFRLMDALLLAGYTGEVLRASLRSRSLQTIVELVVNEIVKQLPDLAAKDACDKSEGDATTPTGSQVGLCHRKLTAMPKTPLRSELAQDELEARMKATTQHNERCLAMLSRFILHGDPRDDASKCSWDIGKCSWDVSDSSDEEPDSDEPMLSVVKQGLDVFAFCSWWRSVLYVISERGWSRSERRAWRTKADLDVFCVEVCKYPGHDVMTLLRECADGHYWDAGRCDMSRYDIDAHKFFQSYESLDAMRLILGRAISDCTTLRAKADAIRAGVFERAVKLGARTLKVYRSVKKRSNTRGGDRGNSSLEDDVLWRTVFAWCYPPRSPELAAKAFQRSFAGYSSKDGPRSFHGPRGSCS